MRLFVMEGFVVRVDPELRIIAEFRDLIAEDKDREKRNATTWFAYIYHTVDYKSPYQMYEEKERHIRILKDLKLDPKFKLTVRMKAALAKYKELQETSATRTLRTTREALQASERGIRAINRKIDEYLSPDEDDESDNTGEAVKLIGKLLDLAEKLPAVVKTVGDLEEQVKKEQSAETKLRGGGSKGLFED
jgi:hypothetical protein